MTNILQVLLGLALVNYLMLDVMPAPSKPAAASAQLRKVLVIAGTTLAVLVPTLLSSAVLERLLTSRFENSVLSTLLFCILLGSVLHCAGLLLIKRKAAFTPVVPVFLLLIFGNCVVMGLTMPADNIALGNVMAGGFLRGVGFTLVLTGFTMLRERVAGADIPTVFRGTSTTFIAAALLSAIFMGFAGLA